MRRKWLEATPEGVDAKTCKAAEGYAFCNRLFELEHQFEKLSAEERLVQRKEKSAPVLEADWTWLNTISRPTGKLKDAVTYAQNQKAHLCAFLEFGKTLIYPFAQSLQPRFSFAFSRNKLDSIRFDSRTDSFPKLLQLPNNDLFRNMEADTYLFQLCGKLIMNFL